MGKLLRIGGFAAITFLPLIASAHEVYVLPHDTIASAMTQPPLQIFDIISDNMGQFFFWAFICVWAVLTVLSISLSKGVERALDPTLARLKRYAPPVARVTLGLAVAASGYFGAMFGPELPFTDFVPAQLIPLFSYFLMGAGALLIVGLFTRVISGLLALLYLGMWAHYGVYMLTYANYFGEILVSLIVGNAAFAMDRYIHHMYPHVFHKLLTWMEQHAFLILRIAFGTSLIFASAYAKFLHAQLAIETVTLYHLTDYFPFSPPFIVLGAFAIELLAGIFIVLGIEIRFASLFLLFWLTLSLLYFGEAVWPHVVLFGVAIALFMHGYDRYTLQWGIMRMRNKRALEPVL